jgi:hypothetical protein
LFVGLFCSQNPAVAQKKQGAVWVWGQSSVAVDFNFNPPKVDTSLYNPSIMGNGGDGTSLCDSLGNLIMFARGSASGFIYNKNGTFMANSISISPGQFGYNYTHLMLEWPGRANQYMAVGANIWEFPVPQVHTSRSANYVVVDASLDSGRGAVVLPANPIPQTPGGVPLDSLMNGRGMIMAHANGRDAWILLPYTIQNIDNMVFDTIQRWKAFLVDSSGIHPPVISALGPLANVRARTKSAPNSEYFVYNPGYGLLRSSQINPLLLLKFNRSTGQVGPIYCKPR